MIKSMSEPPATTLSSLSTRLLTFAVMIVIAVGAIWLIDQRATQRMREYEQQLRDPAPILNESANEPADWK